MTFREKLLTDIQQFTKDNKWEETLNQLIQQILQIKPLCPYTYLQQKVSKLDNTKLSSCICQLALYCLNINPIIQSENNIKNKILSVYIDKHQHTKVRKSQCFQIVTFILLDCLQREKQPFIKKTLNLIDYESNTILNMSQITSIYYYTIVYSHMIKQLNNLDKMLGRQGQTLNIQIIKQYLHTVDQRISIMKKHQVIECLDGNGDLYSIIADWITSKILV